MRKLPWAGRNERGHGGVEHAPAAIGSRASAIAMLAAATFLVGCESLYPLPWGVDTVYEIHDIDGGAQRRLERALDREGLGFERVDEADENLWDPQGGRGRRLVERDGGLDHAVPAGGIADNDYGEDVSIEPASAGRGSTFRFRLRRVRSMADLRRVQNLIQQVSETSRVPVVLQDATMRFASVSGRGSARIWVSGVATPGAEVILDVGQQEVRALVDDRGDWTAAVERTSQLRRRGGWIYALIRKGRAKQYLRMNVLDVNNTDRLLYHELPPDCSLRRY